MKLDFQCDAGCADRASIGLIILQADETLEREFSTIFPIDGVGLYHVRIPSAHEVNHDTLKSMLAELPKAAALLPGVKPMDVVAYCCTSGATVIGTDRVAEAIQPAHPGAAVTNPVSAVIAACQHLKVSKVGLVTPYVPAVSRSILEKLAENGISAPAFGSFEQEEETVVARITEPSVKEAICAVGADPEVEAVFASCTNLRSFSIIKECEDILGKPIITSNQALAWHVLTLAGIPTNAAGPGRLFTS